MCRQLRQPVARGADGDERAQRHAALAGGAERGAGERVERMRALGVRQQHGVVLGAQVRLHALAVGRAAREDVLAGAVAADEADGAHGGRVEQKVDGARGAVHDVQHARRQAGLARQLGQQHGGGGRALRRLQHDAVARYGGDGDGPQRDHGGEVF